MKLLRVALLTETYYPDPGGLAISSHRLARLLASAGHEVHVIVPSSQRLTTPVTCTYDNGITIHRLSKTSHADELRARWFDYTAFCHTATPFDVIHAYFLPQAGFVAASVGQYLSVPSVVSARGNDLDRAVFDPRKAAHVLYALHHATAITANTCDLVRKAHAFAPGRTATLVANGVDTAVFCPNDGPYAEDMHKATTRRNEPARLLFVGEARAKKGLAPLLVAYRTVAAQRSAELVLVGGIRNGDDAAMVSLFRTKYPHLPLHVVDWTEQTTLLAYYRQTTILLMPSLHDGLPNALLEGMATGCAVVGTTVGGIADVVQDGVNGSLVPPGDADALATAIIALLDAPQRREQLGANARATVIQAYSPANELTGYLQVYTSVIRRDA